MTPQDYLLYDGRLPYIVEFPGVPSSTTDLVIGGGTYNPTWTVEDLVANNPQYFMAKGSSGVKTLHSFVMEPYNTQMMEDIRLTGLNAFSSVTSVATYVGPRYPLVYGFSHT